jgi:hypothetical protein
MRTVRTAVRSPAFGAIFGVVVGVLGLAAGGCTVGEGTGSAVGMLFDVGCDKGDSLKPPAKPYSLQPTFFAGEPIEDVCPPPGQCSGPRMNRLVIRLQHNGNRVEVNDTLYFNVENSYKVAQCVRGQTKGGVAAWDTRLVTAADGTSVPGLSWCDWNAGALDGGVADAGASDAGVADAGAADGGVPATMAAPYARINLSTQDFVQASLAPLHTCVEARSVAVALPGSWIEFQDFGSARQGGTADTRADVTGDFKVSFGERLRASFHLVLGDQAVTYATMTRAALPDQRIGGELDGTFDFDLERGRAAQQFP